MFLVDPNTRYTRTGSQVSGPAMFLILMQGEADDCQKVKGLVRRATLRQCGHFMLGRVEVDAHKISLSGSYGADGLMRVVPDDIYRRCGLELPQHLYEMWRTGGGWNGAGSEAKEIRRWALSAANRKALTAKPVAWHTEHPGSPCLDNLSDDELEALDTAYWKRPMSIGREWYGPVAGAAEAAALVRQCASWIKRARKYRLDGNVDYAVYIESELLQRDYAALPAFAKW